MLSWTVSKAGGPKQAEPAAVAVRQAEPAAVAVRNKLYSFGGICYGATLNIMEQMDVHVFNTVSLSWKKLPPVELGRGDGHLEVPFRRHGLTAVLVEDTVYIWGGYPYCNVLYAFDVDTHRWFKPSMVSGTVPEERSHHSAFVLEKVMFIHGGTQQNGYTNDMYKLDTSTMVWTLMITRGTPPPATYRHSATIIGTKMFLFGPGGFMGGQVYNTIRVFDTETNQWMNTPFAQRLPEGRHSAFAYNGELYIFGGSDGNQVFNDVWKFSPETFSWKKVEPKGKGPGPMFGMSCCMVGDRIILFGGYKLIHTTPTDELYILDLSPSLKTLSKLAVIQYGLDQSELTHDIRWELVAMTTNSVLTANKVTK